MTIKHIYWFAYFGTEEPSVRYRGKYPLQQLKAKHGITYDFVIPGYRPARMYTFINAFCSALFFRKRDSVIVFEKIHTKRIYGTALKLLLKLRPSHTIYDMDDADYLKFPPENIIHFIAHTSRCAVGSSALGTYAAGLNKNVFTLTSPVYTHHHFKIGRNKLFTIGWIGYYNAHRESLIRLLFPALCALPFPVRLVLMGVTKPEHFKEVESYFENARNVVLDMPRNIDWQDEEAIYERIATFDVGVAPLLDTDINRAKSAFKLKQYLSCGIPALATGLGENLVFLRDGENGFVCNGPDDFARAIQQLYIMPDEKYQIISANAISSVGTFSMDNYCQTLLANL